MPDLPRADDIASPAFLRAAPIACWILGCTAVLLLGALLTGCAGDLADDSQPGGDDGSGDGSGNGSGSDMAEDPCATPVTVPITGRALDIMPQSRLADFAAHMPC